QRRDLFEARRLRAGDYTSPSSASSSSSSSSSSSTGFSSSGLTVTISKSVPHSGHDTTSPSSTSSSSMSRSLSHSGQYTMNASVSVPTLIIFNSPGPMVKSSRLLDPASLRKWDGPPTQVVLDEHVERKNRAAIF